MADVVAPFVDGALHARIGVLDRRQVGRRGRFGGQAHGGRLDHAAKFLQVAQDSLVRPALLCQAKTSGSNQFHCSAASTRVPTLGLVLTMP